MSSFNAKELRSYILKSFLALVVFCIVFLLILNIFPVLKIYKLANSIKSDAEKIKTVVATKDFKTIFTISNNLKSNSEELIAAINDIKIINYIPQIDKNLNSLDQLAQMIVLGSDSYIKAYPIIEKNSSVVADGTNVKIISMPKDKKVQLINSISDYKESIDQIQKNISDINLILTNNQDSNGLIAPLKSTWKYINSKKSYIDEAETSMQIIYTLPDLLGAKKPAKYLLLFQNNTELRPTGGFIGTYGILTVKDGDIQGITTDNIYNLDNSSIGRVNVEPPKALKDYLRIDKLFLRDSNWNPDYVKSAQVAQSFYKKESANSSEITGVFAITPVVLEDIIGYFGEVEAMGIKFNKENATDVLNYETKFGYWEKQGIPASQRKVIIQKLSDALFAKIKALSFDELKGLMQSVSKDLTQKQILLYFNNKTAQKFITDNNWGGEMVDNKNSDYVAVVDANLISGKADFYVDRAIDYDLKYVDNDLVATLSVTYTDRYQDYLKNTTYQDDPSYLEYYKSYTRIYVPEGAWLESIFRNDNVIASKNIEFNKENGKTYFGFYVSIPKDETATYKLTYKIPKNLESKFMTNYSLIFQKQAGLVGNKLNINIDLNKPIKSSSVSNINNDDVAYNYYNKKFNFNGFVTSDKNINLDLYSESDMSYLQKIIKLNYLSFNKEAPLGN